MPKLMRARVSVYAAQLPAHPSAQDHSPIFGLERWGGGGGKERQLTKNGTETYY